MQGNAISKAVYVSVALSVVACSASESQTRGAAGSQANVAGSTANIGGRSTTGDTRTNVSSGGATSHNSATAAQGGTSNLALTTTTSSAGGAHIGGQATGGKATGGASASTRTTGGRSQDTGGTGASSTTSGGKATGGQATGGVSMGSGGTAFAGSTANTTVAGGAGTGGGAPGGGSNATGGSGNGLLVPANGALLGAFTPAQTEAELQTTETQIGRKWAIHLGYFDWADNFASFAQADIAAGRIPYVTIEPWKVSLDSIASGAEDATIKSRASSISGLKGKILLRFAHEMNGNWYPWDGYDNGANSAAAQKYITAYRHIHDVFASSGVTNVLWVFCPNVDSVPNETWNQWSNYYPGDSYVDWMGYDGYNWGTDTFASMTSRIYSGLAAKNKPIILGETSTQDAEKANWISAIVPAMKSQFPQLKALVWFDVNKEKDWRYDSTSSSLAAFITMAKDPYFNP